MTKGRFLTQKALIRQLNEKGMYKVSENELYMDEDGTIYLVWRLFQTDNFTWINSNDWDIRCSHLHDVGCKYHQIIKVNLSETELYKKGFLIPLYEMENAYCKDIPAKYLEIINVSGHFINNLFYRMLRASGAPKIIQCLYRAGVSLNFNWFLTGKEKIELDKIYEENWNTQKG